LNGRKKTQKTQNDNWEMEYLLYLFFFLLLRLLRCFAAIRIDGGRRPRPFVTNPEPETFASLIYLGAKAIISL